jgi:hypothetical protein
MYNIAKKATTADRMPSRVILSWFKDFTVDLRFVGWAVGGGILTETLEGEGDGIIVGLVLGAVVGDDTGTVVGDDTGTVVGDDTGAVVGDAIGWRVGSRVGRGVGSDAFEVTIRDKHKRFSSRIVVREYVRM